MRKVIPRSAQYSLQVWNSRHILFWEIFPPVINLSTALRKFVNNRYGYKVKSYELYRLTRDTGGENILIYKVFFNVEKFSDGTLPYCYIACKINMS